MTDGDRALDFDMVSAELHQLGISREGGDPLTERQIRRLADDHKLPFFKAPTGRRLIMRSALLETVAAWQVNARRAMSAAAAEAERARRPKGRA